MKKGFNLIQLLIIIAIMAVLSAIAIPFESGGHDGVSDTSCDLSM